MAISISASPYLLESNLTVVPSVGEFIDSPTERFSAAKAISQDAELSAQSTNKTQ
ncbi:hypothetical protein [Halomicronema sp. CCY15110]|uniref:hypothetical protein n=1 Tax=Halomicronema sp. CCY15110 TaxID=2767773 RepID=UPI00194E4129|nr:hypothetical protein [Halomicronema sp. CCY15110]